MHRWIVFSLALIPHLLISIYAGCDLIFILVQTHRCLRVYVCDGPFGGAGQ